ncbi:MAG: ribbon-helix-helix protein, CopG family [Cyanophyceae cyanobacterium]
MAQYQERVLGAPVPQKWIERFELLSAQTGRSLTELVREAIAQYIGMDREVTVELEEEIVELKQKVSELEPHKQQLKSLHVRLEILEQKLSQTQADKTFQQSATPSPMLDDDDFDDEPDEILTDFLPQ